jgi:hypothetical protein
MGTSSEVTCPYTSADEQTWIIGSIPVMRTASRRLVVPMTFDHKVVTGELKLASTLLWAAR